MLKIRRTISPLLLILICLAGCNSPYTPKPRGYFRIDFPPHEYRNFDRPGYPYTFEYPVYANVIKDSSFFDTVPENPYWINVDFPRFNARIYISYKLIGPPPGHPNEPGNTFDKLTDDAFKMTYRHTVKASSIDQTLIHTPNGIGGIFFHVGGNAATAQQFFLTDTTRNFLRGALYFDTTPNEDSLAVVNNFLQVDLNHLINTFKWKNPGPPPQPPKRIASAHDGSHPPKGIASAHDGSPSPKGIASAHDGSPSPKGIASAHDGSHPPK